MPETFTQDQGQTASETGTETAPETATQAPASSAGETSPAPELKYSDRDLDKYKGSARKAGRDAAINELLTRVEGAQSVDDLVAAYEAQQTAEAAAKTELDIEKEARQKAETRAEKAEELANKRLIDSELRLRMVEKGVPADRIADALRLVERDDLKVSKNGEVEGLEEAVTATLEPRSYLTSSAGATAETAPSEAPDGAATQGQQSQTYTAPDATPRTPPKLDVSTMTDEQIDELAKRVTLGGPVPTIP